MITVEVKALSKHYGRVRAVEDVSFSIARGEVFGYLGPNGSGKTTTLRCLMGLLSPTEGEVSILGHRVVPGRATAHREVGYLPGDFRIWGGPTARRSLQLLARLGGTSPDKDYRHSLAKRLGLDLDRPVRQLSKGNRQKVGVVSAFQHRPKLLVLDEPTSGLDPLVRLTVLDMIREAAAGGATVLLSSHNLSEVAAVCHRAAILRSGRQVALAPLTELVAQREQRLEVVFSDPNECPEVPSAELGGVRPIRREPGNLLLGYHGSPDAVLKWLCQFRIDRIDTPQTSLEEAFLEFYPGARDSAGKGEEVRND